MCNLNAFQRLEKDATELVAKKITEQTKLLMSVSKKYDTDFKDEDDKSKGAVQTLNLIILFKNKIKKQYDKKIKKF